MQRLGRAILSLVLLTPVSLPLAAQDKSIPEPETGKWAVTTLSLLRHSQSRCESISRRLAHYWKGLGGSAADQQRALESYIMGRTTSDMSAARAALDLVRRLLPKTKAEADPVTGAVLQDLYDLQNQLCNIVAQPTPPRDKFEGRLQDVLTQIEAREIDLGRLMLIPPMELEQDLLEAIRPYLRIVESAGKSARKEYNDYLDSLKPEKREPTLQELMETWHAGYVERVAPTKEALARYLKARRENRTAEIARACKDIVLHAVPLLENTGSFEAPDPRVKDPLVTLYMLIRRLGVACAAGRFQEADQHWEKTQAWLRTSRSVLARYSLQP